MNNESVALKFPTMLRKMWSGGEVQAWIDKLPPLYTTPQIKELSDEEILSKFMNAWKDFLMVEQGTNGVMNVQMVALHFYKLGLNHENL